MTWEIKLKLFDTGKVGIRDAGVYPLTLRLSNLNVHFFIGYLNYYLNQSM